MEIISAARGCPDILPAETWKWQAVERIARQAAGLYHFDEIRTPIIEYTDLFHRGVGEGSDVVRKEMFSIDSRGERALSLRPEGTAGVVRAMIEHSLLADQGSRAKVFYIGANFRFERPQAARFRQHHQFGVEAFGLAEPEQDVECILLQMDFYRRCGVKDLELQVNSLGDRQSKERYREALVAYLTPLADRLGEESRRRLESNPLRILDSKEPGDQALCQGAPPAGASLSDASRRHFDRVQALLSGQGVSYRVNASLVRGFDYYTETLWEVVAGGLGAQDALGGGGRYDNLVEQLGGRPTPGVGFGSGLERLLIALNNQGATLARGGPPLVWLIAHGEAARESNYKLLADLRAAGIACDMDLGRRNVKAQFKLASGAGAAWSVTVGETELAAGTVVLKDMASRTQMTVPRSELAAQLRERIAQPSETAIEAPPATNCGEG